MMKRNLMSAIRSNKEKKISSVRKELAQCHSLVIPHRLTPVMEEHQSEEQEAKKERLSVGNLREGQKKVLSRAARLAEWPTNFPCVSLS